MWWLGCFPFILFRASSKNWLGRPQPRGCKRCWGPSHQCRYCHQNLIWCTVSLKVLLVLFKSLLELILSFSEVIILQQLYKVCSKYRQFFWPLQRSGQSKVHCMCSLTLLDTVTEDFVCLCNFVHIYQIESDKWKSCQL